MPANPLMFGGNIARAERAQNRKNPVSHASLPPARNQFPRWPKEANNRACGARNPGNMLKASKAS
jgi:hypothetical protein